MLRKRGEFAPDPDQFGRPSLELVCVHIGMASIKYAVARGISSPDMGVSAVLEFTGIEKT